MAKMAAKKSGKKAGAKTGVVVPQKHGGAIYQGAPKNPVAGTGRPPEAIRAAMRELGAAKGVPFLSDILDGKIPVQLIGICNQCKAEQKMDDSWARELLDKVGTSIDHRLKANEQALKYGLGTKEEITVVSAEVKSRLARQIQVITASLDADSAASLLAQLDEVWS